jgi:TDG/mug DNA glycosylase family protein
VTVDSGFAPIARRDAQVLILGSLPGRESLARQQYYAHPRNAFWPIMGALFGAGLQLSYAVRARQLREHRVAVWDVCAAARRPGSLDAAIHHRSVVPNDFAAFLRAHRHIGLICFNGAKAAELYRRLVLPSLPEKLQLIPRVTLPSTSPAHAARSHADKLRRWADELRPFSTLQP